MRRPGLVDMALTGLVAALMFVPLAGIHLNDNTTPSGIDFHWRLAAALIAGTVILRALATQRWPTLPRVRFTASGNAMALLAALAAIALPFTPMGTRAALDVITLVMIYAMLGTGLNVVVGFTGLLDLGFIAFFAIGAYTYALLATGLGIGFWLCLPLAALIPALCGLLVGLPVLRLRGDYFAIVTLGFGQIVYAGLVNWHGLTHGSQGIGNIPRPGLFGLKTFDDPQSRIMFLYYVMLVLLAATAWLVARLRRAPIGRAWEAVREDPIAAAGCGLSVARVRLSAYAVSSAIAGLAGAFFAARQGFVSPESFTFMDSAIVLAIVVLAGAGRAWGVILSAAIIIGLPEAFREFADYRMLLFGAGMVAVMQLRPGGLAARRHPTVRATP